MSFQGGMAMGFSEDPLVDGLGELMVVHGCSPRPEDLETGIFSLH